MKKLTALILAISIFVTFAAATPLSVSADDTADLSASAKAFAVYEANTKTPLILHNADAKLPMASLTKMMVLLIIAQQIKEEKISFEDIVTASPHAASMTGSVIWLNPGEKLPLGELIKSIVIASANDSTVAAAEFISGSEQQFVNKMNAVAEKLGMTNTHYVNCVGYDDKMQYTTASDTAKLTSELFKYDYFFEFMHTRLDYARKGTDRETQLLNTNKLAYSGGGYPNLLGGKTGTTDLAGYCLAECAQKGEMKIVTVVLGAPDDETRVNLSEKLLDRGFSEFQIFKPSFDTEKISKLSVTNGVKKTVKLKLQGANKCVIPKGSEKNISYAYEIPETSAAPVIRNKTLGKAEVLLNGKVILKADVISAENVELITFPGSAGIIGKGVLRF